MTDFKIEAGKAKDVAFLDGHSWGIGMYWYTDPDTGKRESGYGIGYRPENPHDFYPDMDCCDEDEIEAWKHACTEWDKKHGIEEKK